MKMTVFRSAAFARQAIWPGAVLIALLACRAGTDQQTTDSMAKHAAVSDSLVGPGSREGVWQDADERSTWTAQLDGPRITQIDEISLFTDSARSVRRFRFDSAGHLVTLREERSQLVFGERAMPDTVLTLIELEWVQDSLARSAKRVNGVDRLLQPFEVDNFRAHADELLRLVRAGSSNRPSDQIP